MQEKTYLARYGRVWRNKKTHEVVGDKLTLKNNETLAMHEQIPAPKNETKANEKIKKPAKEPFGFGGFSDTNKGEM